MPTETPTQTYRTAVALPESIIAACQRKATAAGRKLEDWISERLRKCANHDAQRELYFNDVQRERLEQIFGGVTFNSPDDVLRLVESRYTLNVADERGILVNEAAYAVLRQRSIETSIPLPDIIRETVANAISDSAWGGH